MKENLANEALVSVIIPTHNRAEMLKRAVQSVQNQDYTNLEIIIIADNCTDNTADVIENIADQRIIFIQTSENVGGAQARNIGLDRATGEYIAFLDDDDEWLAGKVRKQVEVLEKNSDTAIVTCSYIVHYENGQEAISNPLQEIDLETLLYRNYVGSFSFGMTKKEYLADLRINPQFRSAQDWDLWIKILTRTQKKCLSLTEVLVKYYDHGGVRISKAKTNWLYSFVLINRQNWILYKKSHQYYQCYYLNYKLNDIFQENLWYKFLFCIKTVSFLLKSKNYTNYDLLESFSPLFSPRLRLKISKLLS